MTDQARKVLWRLSDNEQSIDALNGEVILETCYVDSEDIADIVADHNALVDVPREEVEKGIIGDMKEACAALAFISDQYGLSKMKHQAESILERLKGGK